MYHPAPSPRDRSASLAAVLLIHVGLVYALLNLSSAVRLPLPDDLTQLIDVTAVPPPPIVEIEPQREKPKEKEGAASARNIESQATPLVAPRPAVELPTLQPIAASPTPGQGLRPTQGASDVVGPGTGAGGSGTGTGSGGSGAGDGGGGVATRASLLSASLRSRDYPSELRRRWPPGGGAFVSFTVEPNGLVTNCRIFRSSGDPVIDMVTCSLVTARFVYRPAFNQRGQPVASQMAYEQRN